MKIKFLSIFLLLSCSNSMTSKKSDLIIDNLKGKVVKLTEITYNAIEKFGEPVKGEMTDKSIYEYNESGNKTEWYNYVSNEYNTFEFKEFYEYDDKGNKVKWSNKGDLSGYGVNKFDKYGNVVELSSYNSDGKLSVRNIYKYDKDNNMSELSKYVEDGSLNSKYTYKYNSSGELIEEKGYTSKGDLYFIDKYYYKNGLLMGYIDINNNVTTNFTYKYLKTDKQGNWLVKIKYKNSVPIEFVEREIIYYQ